MYVLYLYDQGEFTNEVTISLSYFNSGLMYCNIDISIFVVSDVIDFRKVNAATQINKIIIRYDFEIHVVQIMAYFKDSVFKIWCLVDFCDFQAAKKPGRVIFKNTGDRGFFCDYYRRS